VYMPSRQRSQRPQPACTSTVTRSPNLYSSTPGPNLTMVPMYSWPGVKFLLNGSPPWIRAGVPLWMISRSVAQTAIASMRTSTSAAWGWGTGLSTKLSWSGSPRTQAFMVCGILKVFWRKGASVTAFIDCSRNCFGSGAAQPRFRALARDGLEGLPGGRTRARRQFLG